MVEIQTVHNTRDGMSIIVVGHPDKPPSVDDVIGVMNKTFGAVLSGSVNNVVEDVIDTNNIVNISNEGFTRVVIIEFEDNHAISVNRNGEELVDFSNMIHSETGAIPFLVSL